MNFAEESRKKTRSVVIARDFSQQNRKRLDIAPMKRANQSKLGANSHEIGENLDGMIDENWFLIQLPSRSV